MISEDLMYTKEHEWVRFEGNIATVGITDFAQGQLGDIVYVDVDTEGDTLGANEVFGSIEAVKTVSDLFIPLPGRVLEVNEAIEDEPELVNNEPYDGGWIIKIELAEDVDLSGLLSPEEYKNLIE
jgi:glycine cleavage system H protein